MEVSFGNVHFETSNIPVEILNRQPRVKVRAGDVKLRVISMWMQFKARRLEEITRGMCRMKREVHGAEPWGIPMLRMGR